MRRTLYDRAIVTSPYTNRVSHVEVVEYDTEYEGAQTRLIVSTAVIYDRDTAKMFANLILEGAEYMDGSN